MTRCRPDGEFEYLERAFKRLSIVVPFTLAIISILIYLALRRLDEAALLMITLPFAAVVGFWYVWMLGHEGALQPVRPKAMTVAVILAGLAPIMWSEETGAEVMQRIACR
jgi:copper/silver efflux system protein